MDRERESSKTGMEEQLFSFPLHGDVAGISCTQCRRAHRKCDRRRPKCARCLQYGTPCTYGDPPTRSKIPSLSNSPSSSSSFSLSSISAPISNDPSSFKDMAAAAMANYSLARSQSSDIGKETPLPSDREGPLEVNDNWAIAKMTESGGLKRPHTDTPSPQAKKILRTATPSSCNGVTTTESLPVESSTYLVSQSVSDVEGVASNMDWKLNAKSIKMERHPSNVPMAISPVKPTVTVSRVTLNTDSSFHSLPSDSSFPTLSSSAHFPIHLSVPSFFPLRTSPPSHSLLPTAHSLPAFHSSTSTAPSTDKRDGRATLPAGIAALNKHLKSKEVFFFSWSSPFGNQFHKWICGQVSICGIGSIDLFYDLGWLNEVHVDEMTRYVLLEEEKQQSPVPGDMSSFSSWVDEQVLIQDAGVNAFFLKVLLNFFSM
jgi:hypothetical protein